MIVGAGLAGLITAHAFPTMPIVEASPEPRAMHKALLRFRSTAVGDLVGIEFKPVTVRKGIWNRGWLAPSINSANAYSLKVTGKVLDRSIWNLQEATRFIAPDDLYERLIESVGHRIRWKTEAPFNLPTLKISTAPLPATLEACGIEHDLTFERAPITVCRLRVLNADVYQTVYYPSPDTRLYRASMTGDMLIAEFVGEPEPGWLDDCLNSFGLMGLLDLEMISEVGVVEQKYGKIAPVDDAGRRRLIVQLTQNHDVFSIGRFATWRNILLDDVVNDITVVKRLIGASPYHRALISVHRSS